MKLLHLEDNDADAELVAAVLSREWPDCQITRLFTAREFKASLQLDSFDLILSDYSMPGFDGLSALEIVRAACPETPFVFLSGTIGEERAIDALKMGAMDYVLKDSPGRLLSAVRGALRHSQRERARRDAEEGLRKSQEQFQQIAETIDDFIVLLDQRGHCHYANPAFQKLLISPDGAAGASIFDRVHPRDVERLRAFLKKAGQVTNRRDVEFRLVLPNGEIRHLEARVSVPHHSNPDLTLLLAGRDVTVRKAAEEKLHEQASLLGKARDAICLINLEFTITHWNASAERIYGRPAVSAIGHNLRDLLFASQGPRFDTAFALTLAHGEWQGEFRLCRPDGRDLVVESSWSLVNDAQGRPKSILCIDTDVTSRKQLELELQRAQRIEGLGMLAGGIAHDLNNILSPILMAVDLLRPLASAPEDREILDTMEASASHGTDLVRQILLFARGEEGERVEMHVGKLLDELDSFLKTTLSKRIDLRLEYESDLWPVLADATQVKQVLMNLCVNARDAMPGGGAICISASNIRVRPGSHHGFHGEIPAGPHIRLSVADTGTGIPPEALEKIFDPFFTTKELGKGTGLGLSTIAGIVQNHEGAIQVETVAGQGTTFHIYLPATAVQAPPLPPPPQVELPQGQGELVLVIDDDEGIRLIVEKILSAHGYTVCTAADGQSGLDEFHLHRDAVRLVICDQRMPGLRGGEVLAQIHQQAPEVSLMGMSGFREEASNGFENVSDFITFLHKPLKADTLVRTVRQAIDTAVALSTV